MRHNFLFSTVTRVLHVPRFTPGPGEKELGGAISGMCCSMSARREKPGQENPFFPLKKEAQ